VSQLKQAKIQISLVAEIQKFKRLNLKMSVCNMWMPIAYWNSLTNKQVRRSSLHRLQFVLKMAAILRTWACSSTISIILHATVSLLGWWCPNWSDAILWLVTALDGRRHLSWKTHSIPISMKIRLMKALMWPIAMYGC